MQVVAAGSAMIVLVAGLLAGCAGLETSDVGQELFETKCVPCHGMSGKGDGTHFTKGADLTTLAKRNGGVFPAQRVYDIIDGRLEVSAHGSRLMPTWGEEFLADAHKQSGDTSAESFTFRESQVQAKIQALVDFLSRLQEKE